MLKIKLNLRKVVAIAICLAASVTMFAQEIITSKDGTEIQASAMQKEKKYQWGIKGGLNVAYQMDGKLEALYYSRQGIHLGIFMEIPLSAKVGFQPELMYSMQGMGERWGDGLTTKLDYIVLPLMFKFYVWKNRLSIDVGPAFGYMISANISGDGRTIDVYDGDWNKFEVSIGLGMSFRLTDKFDLAFRANAGMTDVAKDMPDIMNIDRNISAVWQLGVAYRF